MVIFFPKCTVRKQWVKKGIKSLDKEVLMIDDSSPLASLDTETATLLPALENSVLNQKIWVKKGYYRPCSDYSPVVSLPILPVTQPRVDVLDDALAMTDSVLSEVEDTASFVIRPDGASQSILVPAFPSFLSFLSWMIRQVY
jgi:hypothetical protein